MKQHRLVPNQQMHNARKLANKRDGFLSFMSQRLSAVHFRLAAVSEEHSPLFMVQNASGFSWGHTPVRVHSIKWLILYCIVAPDFFSTFYNSVCV